MDNFPDRISPLEELAMPFAGEGQVGVVICERICGSLIQVQAWPNTTSNIKSLLKKNLNQADVILMETGPARWLIDDDVAGLENKLRKLISAKSGAITSLTHARVVVNISGPKAEWIMASGVALDFCADAFPVGSTQLCHHHEIGLTIHRTGEESFDLYVFTSFARAFWGWLTRASAEVGYSVG